MICPDCGSSRIELNGHRYLKNGTDVQRYGCKNCGFRFSDNAFKLSETNNNRQLCVSETKKLESTTETKTVAGIEDQNLKGNLTVYMVKATQKGLSDTTIRKNIESIRWLAKKSDLNDPVKIWHRIDNKKKWKSGTKQRTASAYKSYAKFLKIPISEDLDFNKWVVLDQLPSYIPTETELVQLISGCNKKTSTMLQLLLETGIRSGEAWFLKWDNFDFERNTLTLNAENCEKKGIPRQFKISNKLVAMLNLLKKKYKSREYVWNRGPRTLNHFRSSFLYQRKRLAVKLQNPNLLKVKLHTLRHFYACKLYHETKDILLVKSKLGHRNIQNTLVYTRLVEWDEPDNWIVRRPTTSKEEDELIEAGFEYVRFDDRMQTPIYKKRK